MEEYLDLLQSFLIANVITSAIGDGAAVTWIIGDPGMSAPTSLPVGYLVPLWDNVAPISNGVDMDTYIVPLLIIDDLHKYGPPVENANAPGGLEQPGYRVLMQYGQATRAALRAGGAAITLDGSIATSVLPAINFVWVAIDKKPYRGVRLAVSAQQRRSRGA